MESEVRLIHRNRNEDNPDLNSVKGLKSKMISPANSNFWQNLLKHVKKKYCCYQKNHLRTTSYRGNKL